MRDWGEAWRLQKIVDIFSDMWNSDIYLDLPEFTV